MTLVILMAMSWLARHDYMSSVIKHIQTIWYNYGENIHCTHSGHTCSTLNTKFYQHTHCSMYTLFYYLIASLFPQVGRLWISEARYQVEISRVPAGN